MVVHNEQRPEEGFALVDDGRVLDENIVDRVFPFLGGQFSVFKVGSIN